MGLILLPLLISAVRLVSADFPCTCTYAAETAVYGKPDTSTQPIGLLHEYDCKPNLDGALIGGWIAVVFGHEVGYLKRTNDTNGLTCYGDRPPTDKLTTKAHAKPESQTPTTTVTTPTTTIPTTTAPTTTATTPTTTIPTTTAPTTTLPTTTAPTTTDTPTLTPVVQGYIELCPNSVRHSTYNTAQFNQSCYVLVSKATNWVSAEDHCDDYDGHLLHISNIEEQAFIMTFLQKQRFTKQVWIGVHDRGHEEHFQWISGDPMTYTNWYQLRKNNIDDHKVEDCGVLVPSSPFNGKWDDVHCGSSGFFHMMHPEHDHPSICQTSISSSSSSSSHNSHPHPLVDFLGSLPVIG